MVASQPQHCKWMYNFITKIFQIVWQTKYGRFAQFRTIYFCVSSHSEHFSFFFEIWLWWPLPLKFLKTPNFFGGEKNKKPLQVWVCDIINAAFSSMYAGPSFTRQYHSQHHESKHQHWLEECWPNPACKALKVCRGTLGVCMGVKNGSFTTTTLQVNV